MATIERFRPTVRMHQAVVHDDLVFTAGQCAETAIDQDVTAQTHEILERIETILAEAGSAKNRVLTANIYLADIADFAAMNLVWDAWISPDGKPVRTTIEARLTDPRFAVEIAIIAAR